MIVWTVFFILIFATFLGILLVALTSVNEQDREKEDKEQIEYLKKYFEEKSKRK